jgi:transcriptional antiterminator RfaH
MNREMTEKHYVAWYVVHTKPRQEARALENLQNQGFECFLPTLKVQKLRKQRVQTLTEPMFSRYLFIQLNEQTQNWGTIRSTLGESKLVSFGHQPTKEPPKVIEILREAPSKPLSAYLRPDIRCKLPEVPCKGWRGNTWPMMVKRVPLC